ncbi:hypothetical protein TIFTF001_006742 [Ficus carica]|uniref:Uncharacterized protein n=1 Tax=Ficus carica TaxID=3494 RepID=A0AA88DFZ3_FICCA|nr:hypothetical protein TIFTF001_006742 [Ficus carica]
MTRQDEKKDGEQIACVVPTRVRRLYLLSESSLSYVYAVGLQPLSHVEKMYMASQEVPYTASLVLKTCIALNQ